jgi:hypothetical protein
VVVFYALPLAFGLLRGNTSSVCSGYAGNSHRLFVFLLFIFLGFIFSALFLVFLVFLDLFLFYIFKILAWYILFLLFIIVLRSFLLLPLSFPLIKQFKPHAGLFLDHFLVHFRGHAGIASIDLSLPLRLREVFETFMRLDLFLLCYLLLLPN